MHVNTTCFLVFIIINISFYEFCMHLCFTNCLPMYLWLLHSANIVIIGEPFVFIMIFFSQLREKNWSWRPTRRCYRHETWSVGRSNSHYSGKKYQPDQTTYRVIAKWGFLCFCLISIYEKMLLIQWKFFFSTYFLGSPPHYLAPPTYLANIPNLLLKNCSRNIVPSSQTLVTGL